MKLYPITMRAIKFYLSKKLNFNRCAQISVTKACSMYAKGGFWRILAKIKHFKNRKKYNIEIYPSVRLGEKIYIPHAVGIVIGQTAVIGDEVIIFPNTQVIARWSPYEKDPVKLRRHAILGNRCILGAGCIIIGDIEIGNNVLIAAGAICTRNVPSNSIVNGINCIIKKDLDREIPRSFPYDYDVY